MSRCCLWAPRTSITQTLDDSDGYLRDTSQLGLQRRKLAARLCQSAAARESSACLKQHERAHIRATCRPHMPPVYPCEMLFGIVIQGLRVMIMIWSTYLPTYLDIQFTICMYFNRLQMHRDKSPSRRRSMYCIVAPKHGPSSSSKRCYPRGTLEVESSTAAAMRRWASQYLPWTP